MSETRSGPLVGRLVVAWWVSVVAVTSHVESWLRRLDYLLRPRPRYFNGYERRHNPRQCVLCDGPMRPDRRPPRDTRMPDGKIRRLPEEVLAWFRCGRCHQSQVGIPQ